MSEEDIEHISKYATKRGWDFSHYYANKRKVDELVNSGRTDLSEEDCLFLLEMYHYGCGLDYSRRYYHPIYDCLLRQKSKKVRRWVYRNFVWVWSEPKVSDLMRLLLIWEAWQQYHDAAAAVILMECAPLEWVFVDQHLEALKESARKGRYGEKRIQKAIDLRFREYSRFRKEGLAEENKEESNEAEVRVVTEEVFPTLPDAVREKVELMRGMGFEIVDE